MKDDPRKTRNLYLSLLMAGLILLNLTLLILVSKTRTTSTNQNVTSSIVSVINSCQSETERLECYRQAAKTFNRKFTLDEIFTVIQNNENNKSVHSGCHSILHFLGQEVYKSQKDISNVLSNGSPVCFAGFYHGALESYFTEEELLDPKDQNYSKLANVIADICSTEKGLSTVKESNECLHGLGHALMFATDSELPSALKLCDKLDNIQDSNWCHSGVFMENSTSSTNADHPSKYINKEDPMYPCNILDSRYLDSCYVLQAFYFFKITDGNLQETYDLCRQIPADFQNRCFSGVGMSLIGAIQNLELIKNNCSIIDKSEYRQACLVGVAGALWERYIDNVKRVGNFCQILDTEDKHVCFNHLITRIKHKTAKDQQQQLCAEIPDEKFKKDCQKI